MEAQEHGDEAPPLDLSHAPTYRAVLEERAGSRRAASKRPTRQAYFRVDVDALDLLDRLAPSENKRGAYVSELIRRAAIEAGLLEPGAGPGSLDLTVLRHQLAAFEHRYQDLQARVDAAIAAQEGAGPTLDTDPDSP